MVGLHSRSFVGQQDHAFVAVSLLTGVDGVNLRERCIITLRLIFAVVDFTVVDFFSLR